MFKIYESIMRVIDIISKLLVAFSRFYKRFFRQAKKISEVRETIEKRKSERISMITSILAEVPKAIDSILASDINSGLRSKTTWVNMSKRTFSDYDKTITTRSYDGFDTHFKRSKPFTERQDVSHSSE